MMADFLKRLPVRLLARCNVGTNFFSGDSSVASFAWKTWLDCVANRPWKMSNLEFSYVIKRDSLAIKSFTYFDKKRFPVQ